MEEVAGLEERRKNQNIEASLIPFKGISIFPSELNLAVNEPCTYLQVFLSPLKADLKEDLSYHPKLDVRLSDPTLAQVKAGNCIQGIRVGKTQLEVRYRKITHSIPVRIGHSPEKARKLAAEEVFVDSPDVH